MATHSSILAQKIPWTEKPDGLRPMWPQRVRHAWAHSTHAWKSWARPWRQVSARSRKLVSGLFPCGPRAQNGFFMFKLSDTHTKERHWTAGRHGTFYNLMCKRGFQEGEEHFSLMFEHRIPPSLFFFLYSMWWNQCSVEYALRNTVLNKLLCLITQVCLTLLRAHGL